MNIYSQDIAECNAFCQDSPENTRRMLLFVVATIQQQLETVPAILDSLEQDGPQSMWAFGFKRDSVAYINANYVRVHNDAIAQASYAADLLAVFHRVPGLGLVKAGFAAQLFANQIGCIDRHNVTLYGIPLSALRCDKVLTQRTQVTKRKRYIALCDGLGGSAVLWSQWCDYLARMRPVNWGSGREVSQFHYECLSGEYTHSVPELFDADYTRDYEQK